MKKSPRIVFYGKFVQDILKESIPLSFDSIYVILKKDQFLEELFFHCFCVIRDWLIDLDLAFDWSLLATKNPLSVTKLTLSCTIVKPYS